MSSTTRMGWAVGSVRGLLVYSASTSVSRNSHCASTIPATSADSVSLSPNRISYIDTHH
jgi:hypothetical protein